MPIHPLRFRTSLAHLVRSGVPLIAFVEHDTRWLDRQVQSIANSFRHSGRALLQWSLVTGWTGSEELTHRLGLSGGRKGNEDPIGPIKHVVDTLSAGQSMAHPAEGEVTLEKGLLIIHDLGTFLDDPRLPSLLLALQERVASLRTTVVFPFTRDIPDDHPLRPALTMASPPPEPLARYGGIARALVGQMGSAIHEECTPEAISDALDGLSITDAETVLRLVAGTILDAPGEAAADVVAMIAEERKQGGARES